MITYEKMAELNANMKRLPIHGKSYADVPQRVQAFRQMCPDGTITTEILEMANGVVTMKATVADENGKVLATGMAQEKEKANRINATSYIENCETSAVGRALGMIGIGSETSIASAEEVQGAIDQQEASEKPSAKEIDAFKATLTESQLASIEKHFEKKIEELDRGELGEAMQRMSKINDKGKSNS